MPESDKPDDLLDDRTGVDEAIAQVFEGGFAESAESAQHFVDEVVFGRHTEWTQAAADPLEANRASWRALEKAGFRHVGVLDDDLGPCRLMAIDRPS